MADKENVTSDELARPRGGVHWRYAAGQAFQSLEAQVRDFCFKKYAGEHTYSGFLPGEFIEVIDGFLNEDSTVVPGTNRKELQTLRQLLLDDFAPAYEAGRGVAEQMWERDHPTYGSLSNRELHELAEKSSMFKATKKEWFIEGFCKSWAETEMQSLRSEVDKN